MSNIEKYKKDIEKLVTHGEDLLWGLYNELEIDIELHGIAPEEIKKIKSCTFRNQYQGWYNESLAVIKQLTPERLEDFVYYYKQPRRKELTYESYTISDYLINIVRKNGLGEIIVGTDSVISKFLQQYEIVKSLKTRFDSTLYDIKQLLQADVFDSEIQSASVLCKKGFYRASGAICGVLIEKHLAMVCKSHNIRVTKKNSTINDFNDLLKNNNIIDTPQFRHIQLMGDLRNICCHNKEKEPNKENTEDLIAGTDKIIKSIF